MGFRFVTVWTPLIMLPTHDITYAVGSFKSVFRSEIATLAGSLPGFEPEKATGLKFDIDVKRLPRDDKWERSITFGAKKL